MTIVSHKSKSGLYLNEWLHLIYRSGSSCMGTKTIAIEKTRERQIR